MKVWRIRTIIADDFSFWLQSTNVDTIAPTIHTLCYTPTTLAANSNRGDYDQ